MLYDENGYILPLGKFIKLWKMLGKLIGGVSTGQTIKMDIFYLLVLREHRQETFDTLKRILVVKGVRGFG